MTVCLFFSLWFLLCAVDGNVLKESLGDTLTEGFSCVWIDWSWLTLGGREFVRQTASFVVCSEQWVVIPWFVSEDLRFYWAWEWDEPLSVSFLYFIVLKLTWLTFIVFSVAYRCQMVLVRSQMASYPAPFPSSVIDTVSIVSLLCPFLNHSAHTEVCP